MIDTQVLCGLTVQADRPLYQDRRAANFAASDVTLTTGDVVACDDGVPDGTVLLSFVQQGQQRYSIVQLGDGSFVLRFNGSAEFEVSADLTEVVVHSVEGADPGLATVLATGALLAFQLYMRGSVVLHASAVDLGDRSLAFVGHSGMGKSTMAGLMCAEGGRLITDDVLRLDFDSLLDGREIARTRLGATELRLRKGAQSLIDRFHSNAPGLRTSADERHVLRLRGDADDCLPLAGIVIPRPNPDRSHAEVRRIHGKNALFALLSFPRLMGWEDRAVLERQLAHLNRLAAVVPVFVADVPWGPPFHEGIASEVLRAVEGAGQSDSTEASGVR